MLKIGLTGGIGSGKTTVAHIFEVLGIPVFYADDAAKKLMNEDANLKAKIIKNFGEQSYTGGKINKQYLATEIFSSPQKTALINSLIHPATIANANHWMDEQTLKPYAIKEAALIFEANAQTELDYVIGVTSPLNLRINRVMQRDDIEEKAVLIRMQKQMDDTEKMNLCHFVLHNNEVDLLIPQVLALNQKLLQLTAL